MANSSTSVGGEAMEECRTGDPGPIRTWRDEDASYMVIPLEAMMDFPKFEDKRDYSTVECNVCEDLASDRPKEAIWRQRSISELDASAETGCKYCLLLSQGIRACVPEVELVNEIALENRLAKVFSEKPPNRYGISIFKGEDDDGWENKVISVRSIPSGDTSSKSAIGHAKEWMRNCIEQHAQCDTGEERPAPSRLIDIELDQTQDVKLIETENMRCHYVCLSHCWGSSRAIKTTKETLQEKKERIRWDALCPTFQDAISVVRQLGLRYLWIDSLCIIQDDDEDWARESSKMATIYSLAHLTIAATRSPNHEGGCFAKLSPQFQTHKITVSGPDDKELTLFFRQLMPHCAGLILSPAQADEFPLLDRAWVYQERLLSPRLLHFHNNELSWECAHYSVCECGEDVGSYMEIYLQSFKRPKVEHARALAKIGTFTMANRWHEIVQEYSGLRMTFQKDALPALSGLAKQMSEHREGEQYVAGLWDSTIFVDMLWAAQSGSGRRPKEWRGPSWSWVSTTAAVTYVQASVFAIVNLYPEIVDSNVRVMSEDRFSQVKKPTWIKIKSAVFTGAKVRYVQKQAEDSESRQAWIDNYAIHAMDASLGHFIPDYNYSNAHQETEMAVPDGSSVDLVLIGKTDNRFLYLVLVKLYPTPIPELAVTWEFDKEGWIYVRERIGLLTVDHHLSTVDPVGQSLEVCEEEILIV